jgi:hypothetical protein
MRANFMSVNLDQVIAEVKELPFEQQQQLRNKLDEILAETTRPEDRVKHMLFEAGLLTDIKTNLSMSEQDEDDFSPIEIKGKPISETIIEERRVAWND